MLISADVDVDVLLLITHLFPIVDAWFEIEETSRERF
jgi:hypothetical protein